MLDMVHPAEEGKITLSDLKKCKLTPIFFDTFFNLEKYLDHEQRDPFATQRDSDSEASINNYANMFWYHNIFSYFDHNTGTNRN